SRPLQPPAGTRGEPGDSPARRAGDRGCGPADAHDRRARATVAQVFASERSLSFWRGISGLVPLNPLEGQAGALFLRIASMSRKFLLFGAAAAAGVAAVLVMLGRLKRGGPETNGGRERPRGLPREVQARRARAR